MVFRDHQEVFMFGCGCYLNNNFPLEEYLVYFQYEIYNDATLNIDGSINKESSIYFIL